MSSASPIKMGGGSTQSFTSAPGIASSYNTQDVRAFLKKELQGKLEFDQASVLLRLRTQYVDDELVKLCQDRLERHDNFLKSKAELQKLCAPVATEALKPKEAEDTPEGGRRKEPQTMKPLGQVLDIICELIGTVGNSQKQYDRKWLGTADRKLVAEGDTFSFPQIKPDFTLCDEYSEIASDKEKKDLEVLWRHRMAFVELKATASQGPQPIKDSTVKEIVAQAADYARLHLSARPFQLFSIGLLIFGRQFCVAIFDRDGVQFSPINDLWDNLDILIRIIRRMSHEMSPVDFGQDPNVQVLHRNDPISVACRTGALRLAHEDLSLTNKIPTYPTYSIDFCGLKYYTIGLPVWNSLSLLGRGTSIWRVTASPASPIAKGPIFVLKTAWRQGKRPSESAILQRVQGSHDGLVKYSKGTDVYFPSSDAITPPKITTANLRNLNAHTEDVTTTALHRLLFETVGRPIWEFDSYLELFLAIKAALAAHRFLADQQILHRDISAGNVLLSSDPKAPDSQKGFLTDLEFARIDDVTLESKNIIPVPSVPNPTRPKQSTVPTIRTHTTWTPPPRGAVLTGTAQFMACELIWSVTFQSPVRHQVYHDVESFIWVIYYAIFRRIGFIERSIKEGDATPALIQRSQATFKTTFGHVDPEAIFRTRENVQRPNSIFGPHATLLPKPVHTFFEDIPNYINAVVRPSKEPGIQYGRCTHEALFAILDKVIGALKAP